MRRGSRRPSNEGHSGSQLQRTGKEGIVRGIGAQHHSVSGCAGVNCGLNSRGVVRFPPAAVSVAHAGGIDGSVTVLKSCAFAIASVATIIIRIFKVRILVFSILFP